MGWIAGGVTALLGTAISIALFTAGATTAELIPCSCSGSCNYRNSINSWQCYI